MSLRKFSIIASSLLLLISLLGIFVFYSVSDRYTVRIYSSEKDHWEGWRLIYNIDEILYKYPELLPCVNQAESRLKHVVEAYEKACRESSTGFAPDSGDTLYWDFEEGLYHFNDICSKEMLWDYFPEYVHDSPYLKAGSDSYMYRFWRSFGRRSLKPDTYYLNAWYDDKKNDRSYFLYGIFIELQEKGFRLAVRDLEDRSVIAIGKDSKEKIVKVDEQFCTPCLPFGKYVISAPQPFSSDRKNYPSPRIEIEVCKEN